MDGWGDARCAGLVDCGSVSAFSCCSGLGLVPVAVVVVVVAPGEAAEAVCWAAF